MSGNGLDTALLRRLALAYVGHLPHPHRVLASRYLLDAEEEAQRVKDMGFIQALETDLDALDPETDDSEAKDKD